MEIKNRRCVYCNWLNKERRMPFICENCDKENNAEFVGNVISKSKEESWFDELVDMKGIGEETAKDIVDIYPTKEVLIEDLNSGTHVPLGNKHVSILKLNLIK